MFGIYAYIDRKTNKIVYIGKDSNIDKNKRHKDHYQPSNYSKQPLNSILQNNIGRYAYRILDDNVEDEDKLNELEIQYISSLNPKFNFTKGGDGVLGLTHSKTTRMKLSEINKGKKLSKETKEKISKINSGENHPMYGKHHTEETKKRLHELNQGQTPWNKGKTNIYSEETLNRMRKAKQNRTPWMKGKRHSDETKKKISNSKKGVTHSNKSKENMSRSKNTTGYLNVSKRKGKTYTQGFTYVYSYHENNKRKWVFSTDINKLEEKVKAKGLKWLKLVEDDNND